METIKEVDKKKLSLMKSIIWRIMGVIVLATITYFFTRKWITTTYITIVHHATFLLVFYLHERLWFKIKNISERKRAILKALLYEIVLGMGIGGLIVLLFTGKWSKVGQITVTYTIIKIIMYYFYERIWRKKITKKLSQ
jgi:uncharacterized membrane protein